MERTYKFPVWGTQGGGLVIKVGKKFIFVEKPDWPGLNIGDEMPEEWEYHSFQQIEPIDSANEEQSLLEEYHNRYEAKPTDPAKKILFAVMNDLLGRSGMDWDGIDDEIKEELLATNLELVRKNLP